jgi:Pyruvate/2-oxoacid:ferredoxin oxidoreductase gamma subunit
VRRDVRMVTLPFTRLADELGATKVGNIVMLGALLEATGMMEQDRVVGALKRLVSPRFFELDLAALARGRQEFRERAADDYLWGV